jgi:hypothetical protein
MIARTLMPASPNPFKAAQSYGPADGDLFFGRDAEGTTLARFLAERPFSVLTAPSGLGKTSLLNAYVIPLLEAERWSTAYTRPKNDPVEALRLALVDHLFPDPKEEVKVARGLTDAIGNKDTDLLSALNWYGELGQHRRLDFRLFSSSTMGDFAPLPILSRALRKSMAIEDVIEQFEALVADGAPLGLTPHIKLYELIELLDRTEISRLRNDWRKRFLDARELSEILALLEDEWLPLRPGTAGILLILDQAEELFTRLEKKNVDALMAEARNLFDWCVKGVPRPHSKPVHLALSLRKEFYADLVPRLRPFGHPDRLTFFLEPMTLDEARQALERPAKLFVDFASARGDEPATIDRILAFALDEGAEAERDDDASGDTGALDPPVGPRYSPTLISLIGDHLWARIQAERKTDGDVEWPLSWQEFRRIIPRLDSIFESFLANAMNRIESKLGPDRASRFDALELLDRLVTTTGFRSIVQEEELVRQLPLKAGEARALLDLLDRDVKLVRRESRRGGRVVEIMHERLIPPVRRMLSELRRQDTRRASLLPAYDMLYTLPDEPNVASDPLPPHYREALVQYFDRLDLDFLATKILLRSALSSGPGTGERARARWNRTIRKLVEAIRSSATAPERASLSLLYGDELDQALAMQSGSGRKCDRETARRLTLSALADRSSRASTRIQGSIRNLIMAELGA